MTTSDIKGLDKVELIKRLYTRAMPQGFGWLHATTTPLTDEEAAKCVSSYGVDYFNGRAMKVTVATDEMRTDSYNHCNGDGAAEAIVQQLRDGVATEEIDIYKKQSIDDGLVPATCTMPGDLLMAILLVETPQGRSACHGCNHDRAVCKGRPKGA